jgi:SHS2 domain-containing protein
VTGTKVTTIRGTGHRGSSRGDDGRVVGTGRGHRSVPHTADVIVEAWGTDLGSCCEEAVAGLAAVFVDAGGAAAATRRRVHLAPARNESLLLDLLEEVIFTLDTADAVPVAAEVAPAGDGGLDVVLLLADPGEVTAAGAVPKAISRSGLQVASDGEGVRCRFLVDV